MIPISGPMTFSQTEGRNGFSVRSDQVIVSFLDVGSDNVDLQECLFYELFHSIGRSTNLKWACKPYWPQSLRPSFLKHPYGYIYY